MYQCTGPLEQEAKVELDPAVMEQVLAAMGLVQGAMAQDHLDMELAQVATAQGLVDTELDLEAMEAGALV